jgi:hypothetical protein
MRSWIVLVVLAGFTGCGGVDDIEEPIVQLGVRLSLDTSNCQTPTMMMTNTMVDGPEDISLGCMLAPCVGQFVRSNGMIIARQCASVMGSSTGGTPATLADLPTYLAGFQSPTLQRDTTISVLIEVTVPTSTAMVGCEPAGSSTGTNMGSSAPIAGESSPVTLTDGVDSIAVALRCNTAPPCGTL